jgi:hypothetical protein
VLGILVPCKLKKSYVAAEFSERVIGLGVSETELEIRDPWETPGRPVFDGELGGDPKLEDFWLTLELVVVLTMVDGREARDIDLPAIIVLSYTLGEKATSLRDLKHLVGGLDLSLLLVP